MIPIKFLPALAAALLVLGGAAPALAASGPAERKNIVIMVVDSLERGPGRITDFDRINEVFTRVFERRKWPATVEVERFAANLPAHDIELRLFYKGTYSEDLGDLTFHAWVTLTVQGRKTDFGIIRFRYYPRALEREEDALEHAVRGAAEMTADKIEPLLFPKDRGAGH